MLILAVEQSTAVGSAALLEDDRVLAERVWKDDRARGHDLFVTLPALIRESGVAMEDVDLFGAGLGPGAFSSLRTSLTAVRALALPGEKPVRGVSSSEALAADICRERDWRTVTIVGDARRRSLWLARFEMRGGRPRMTAGFTLVELGQLPDVLERSGVVASPDFDRIGPELRKALPSGTALIEEMRTPRAAAVARLVLGKRHAEDTSRPLAPIYLHPPVFVKPECFPGGTQHRGS